MQESKRQLRLRAKAGQKQYGPRFEEVPIDKWPFKPKGQTRCFANNRFMVNIYDDYETTKGPAILALVLPLDGCPIKNHWRSMQDVKNEIFGPEVLAVEYYPAESKLVDYKNIYWLWVFPEGILPEKTKASNDISIV